MDENNNLEELDIEELAQAKMVDEQAENTDPDSMGFTDAVEGVSE